MSQSDAWSESVRILGNVTPVTFWVILVPSIILIYWKVKQWRSSKVTKGTTKFVGPKGLPLFGNAFDLVVPLHEMLGVFKKWNDGFGPVVQAWLGNQMYIFIADTTAAEKLMSSNTNIQKSCEYDFLHCWLGTGLLTATGQKWHDRRKLLTPAFHFKILEQFLPILNEQSIILVDLLTKEMGKTIDFYPYITNCALDIICETAMGERISAQGNPESDYANAVYEMTDLMLQRFSKPWLRFGLIHKLINGSREKYLLKILHGFTERVIQERKKHRIEKNRMGENIKSRRLAFLDLLLEASENGKVLSDLDIREETDTFMFEGHDTTVSSLGWATLLLAANPQCQKKLQEELNEIFGEDRRRTVTNADLSKMKYLECCIKESLRIYPSVPMFARQLTQDLDIGNGLVAPKGAILFFILFLMHRNAEIFENPEAFIPERFLPENCAMRPYSYLPFSGGDRNCIGQKFALMEEKVVLANLFRNFTVTTEQNLSEMKLHAQLVLRPGNGLPLKFSML